MKISFSHIIFYWIWILGIGEVCGQTTVGMGTVNPNSNAVLELVSENMDQGFLVPRFTTNQRTASGFSNKLSNKDNGLLVFDTDEGNFYYWYEGGWQPSIVTGSLGGTSTVWYTGNTIPRNDEGKNGDFYIYTLSGDVYRKQNGSFIVIGNIQPQNKQYKAGSGINIDLDNTIVNTGDLDNTNELIKDVSLSGTTLRISDAGGDHDVDLSSLQGGTGTDDQNLGSSKAGNNVTVTIEDGSSTTFSVADTDSNISNETITGVSLQPGDILRITEAGVNHNVDLSSLGGVIGDPASISDFDLLGNTLRITEDGVNHDIDMSSFQKTTLNNGKILIGNASNVATPVSISGDLTLNSDGTMTIKLDAVTTAKIINDAVDKDKIHANIAGAGLGQNVDGSLEIKTTGGLQIAADQLSLTNTGSGQILIGNGSIVNAQTISGDATLASDGTAKVIGLQGRPVDTTAPGSGNVLTWNGSAWVPQAPSGGGSGASWYEGSVVPNAGNPAGAANGDYYYRNSTEVVYRKVSGTWIEQGKWAERSGTDLDVQGPGTITEITTPTLYRGTGKPEDGNGSDNGKPGDLYYDANEDKLWIKKNNTQWTSF